MQKFHSEKSPWAKIKHGILSRYLPLFINKTRLFQQKICLVDGFAGAGKYTSGEDGSAMISANIALHPITHSSAGYFHCLNVEKKKEAFDNLEAVTAEHRQRGLVQNIRGEFEKKLPDILKTIDGQTALFFIDPFGTQGVTASVLKQIAERKGVTEALVRFDDTRVKRLLNYNKEDLEGYNPQAARTAEKFLDRVAELTTEDAMRAVVLKDPNSGKIVVDEYIRLITKGYKLFKFGLAYRVVNPATMGHRYYLAHFSNHPDGYVHMSNHMARVQRTVEKLSLTDDLGIHEQKLSLDVLTGQGSLLTEDAIGVEPMEFHPDVVRKTEQRKVDEIFQKLPMLLQKGGFHG